VYRPTDRRQTTDDLTFWENFKRSYVCEGSSDPFQIWFYGGVLEVGGLNGANSGLTKFNRYVGENNARSDWSQSKVFLVMTTTTMTMRTTTMTTKMMLVQYLIRTVWVFQKGVSPGIFRISGRILAGRLSVRRSKRLQRTVDAVPQRPAYTPDRSTATAWKAGTASGEDGPSSVIIPTINNIDIVRIHSKH